MLWSQYKLGTIRHTEFLRKEITGIPNIATWNSNFLTLQTLEFQKENPTGIFGIKNGIGILLTMGVPEIGTKNWNSQPRMRDGGQKKSCAFSMPFKTPRKKSSCTDNNNDGGFSFGSMMCMMMHQSWMESEQRKRQNKQREHQHRIDAELRKHEYELCREEMAIAREEVCAQRQLMNVMMMSLLNKNGGDNVPCSPGSPMDD
jgi:hypothetical protein